VIQRVFHPIGQGAFYSEKHNGLQIVYDCGVWHKEKNNARVDNLISGSFEQGSNIDILFISHFDYDHISKIGVLNKMFPVKRIVLPLLHDNDKILLSKLYEVHGFADLAQLVKDPVTYFEPTGGKVTFVSMASTSENVSEIIIRLENDVASIPDKIQSGTRLEINDWMFIPYNYDYGVRSIEIINRLLRLKLNMDKILSEPDYILVNRKRIKGAYNALKGKINENSMFLYSGPSSKSAEHYGHYVHLFLHCERHSHFHHYYNRVACIYTGDGDLNRVDLSIVYRSVFEMVGTIQIPHHGDHKSFKPDIFSGRRIICPISVGVDNDYGHPSLQVMSNLIESECYPVLITEKSDDYMIEVIN